MSLRAALWRSNLPFARHHDRFGDCFVAKSAPRNDIHSSFDVCLSSYLSDIFQAIRANRIRVTSHARKEAQTDGLTLEQIYTSVVRGEIIKEYPDDRPYPSCLILGFTLVGQPVHSVWAYNSENQFVVLITVYRPDPDLWVNFRERRK